jgi:hypothetical protein
MAPSAPLSRQLIKQHLHFFQIERVKPSVNQAYGRIDEGKATLSCCGSSLAVLRATILFS